MAGLRVGQAFGMILLPGFGVNSSSPQVPGHPTTICEASVKLSKTLHLTKGETVIKVNLVVCHL